MATAHQAPLLSTTDDSDDLTHLREMYKRYMLNPFVARWLLSREALTDFHTVRRERSVMMSVSSASPPRVIPPHTPHVPFPASSDLMFLDHVHDGFALGHIWGNLQSDTHPYAPLAIRVGKSGWDHVQIRKFACDLSVSGTLEVVEYAWFADNRAMVILSRIPCHAGARIVRTAEVLFFDSVERTDIPPQSPALVLLLHDRSMCTSCGKEICCCPNAIGIDRAIPPSCRITQESALSGDKSVSAPTVVQSWEDRARVVWHGSKRGLLSIVYSGSFVGNFSQITVRQAYVSTCEDQNAIEYRIQQHLTKLLSRIPPVPSNEISKPASAIPAAPPFNSQECALAITQEASLQSPMSFIRKEGHWLDSPRENLFSPSQEKIANDADRGRQDYFSSAVQHVKENAACAPAQGTPCSQQIDVDASAGCTTSSKRSREEHASEKESTSGGAEILPDSNNAQNARAEERDSLQNSLCGPEKTGKDCDCSAEKMPNSSLARILNSERARVVSQGAEDMTAFMEPMLGSSSPGNSNLLQPIPNMNPTALIANMSRQDQRQVNQFSRGPHRYDTQSPNSTRCGTSTTLPSPLPPPPSLQVEPALKRPRTESLIKPELFGSSLDATWHSNLENRDRVLPLPAWNVVGGSIERPLSALSRALGSARSHSPFGLMSGFPKTPSPPVPPVGGQGFSFGKTASSEFDFHSSFDPLPIPSLADLSKKADDRMNAAGLQTNVVSAPGGQVKAATGHSRNIGTSMTENAVGSGVCCDICGITFAKRSNKIRHIQTVHNRVKQFECDLCGTKFGLKADLGRHKFRIHESRAFRCDSCGKSFAEQGQLEHHIRVTHEEDSRPWECNICRMRFGRKSSLTRHEQTVHQQTRFMCRFCKKSYSQKFDAVRHERRVHGIHDKTGSAGIKQLTG